MRKLFLLAALFIPSLASSLDIKEWSGGLGYAYRNDSLNWSISGGEEGPNILSELKWEGLHANLVSSYFQLTTCSNIYVRANGCYGKIFHGTNYDSDYAGDNRTFEFSRSIANAGKGELFDLSAGIGYLFSWPCSKAVFAPLAGAAWNEQHLQLFDGQQLIPEWGRIFDLHSSYKTRWSSFWLGGDFAYAVACNITAFASFEYHWALYRGKGHWNLREEFLSDFKHRSCGHGTLAQAGVNYTFKGGWGIVLIAKYQDWRTRGGTHSVKVDIFDSEPETIKTGLNSVNWHSFQASILATYTY